MRSVTPDAAGRFAAGLGCFFADDDLTVAEVDEMGLGVFLME
jgi:hypothetical protein